MTMIYFKDLQELRAYAERYYKDKHYVIRFDSERKMYYISPC